VGLRQSAAFFAVLTFSGASYLFDCIFATLWRLHTDLPFLARGMYTGALFLLTIASVLTAVCILISRD
jgi:hypothetical protein